MAPGPRPGGSPTMKDVAREAGVSKALVSIVFRGVAGASDETRERVFASAERIGYRTNRAASLLARTRTRHLGVVLDLHNTFQAELVDAAIQIAGRAGYQLVLSPLAQGHGEARAISTTLEFRCEALLLLGPELEPTELSALVGDVPVVCIGGELDLPAADVVRGADGRGMEQVVDHLVGLGHERIAHVDGGPNRIGQTRRAGFEQGVRRHRLLGRSTFLRGGTGEADGRRAVRELLARHEGVTLPTAITAFNDHCALGVLDALTDAGLRVPEDVSVTGYDDTPLAQLAAIDLTSVRQDPTRLAEWAVGAAIERLDAGRTERRELVLDPQLCVRGSSGRARR